MTTKDIIQKVIDSKEDNNLYLVEKLSEAAGFFVSNKKLLYLVKNNETHINLNTKTEYLEMNTNVDIFSVKDFQQFKTGKYNILRFINSQSDKELESFINLCKAHAEYMNSTKFIDFFDSLIDIFQIPDEQNFKNIVGLYGELSVIKYLYDTYRFDITPFWHINGSSSKYDFSLKNFNLEIKTTSSISKLIDIKHFQIFNSENNILGIVFLNATKQGKTIIDLITELKQYTEAFKNINFTINVEKELKRISLNEIENQRFMIINIAFYNCNDINPFNSIPKNIEKLNYKINLTNSKTLDLSLLLKKEENIENR